MTVVHNGIEAGGQRLVSVSVLEPVVGVGHVAEIFHARQVVKIELRGVRQEELVAGGVDDELRHRESLPILIRFYDLH